MGCSGADLRKVVAGGKKRPALKRTLWLIVFWFCCWPKWGAKRSHAGPQAILGKRACEARTKLSRAFWQVGGGVIFSSAKGNGRSVPSEGSSKLAWLLFFVAHVTAKLCAVKTAHGHWP